MREEFDQHELNDLVPDKRLSRKASELLASKLNKKNSVEEGAKVTHFGSKESVFLQYCQSDD